MRADSFSTQPIERCPIKDDEIVLPLIRRNEESPVKDFFKVKETSFDNYLKTVKLYLYKDLIIVINISGGKHRKYFSSAKELKSFKYYSRLNT